MVRHIKKILFTTDLSKSAIEVFKQTVALAGQTGASIAMLHVIEDASASGQSRTVHLVDKDEYEKIRSEKSDMVKNVLIGKARTIPLIQNALKELSQHTESESDGGPSVTIDSMHVFYGNVSDLIIKTADITDCDLIVLGMHKKGSILKALSGSAGKKVIKQSKRPIFLVPLDD